MKDKDIYDLLNDIEFDISDEKEIPLNDISKAKIKKNVNNNIKKKTVWKKTLIIAATACFIIGTTIMTEGGQEVLAKLREKFFFTPGTGVVSVEKESYVLVEPIVYKSEKIDLVIKSAVSNEDGLTLGIWVNSESSDQFTLRDIEENIKIQTEKGIEIGATLPSNAGGGENTYITVSFNSSEIIKDFNLLFYDEIIENIGLKKVEGKDDLKNIGNTDTSSDLLVGGNKYISNGKTYISLWTEEEFKSNGAFYVGFYGDDLKVTNKDGKEYKVNYSDNSGNTKEFVIEKEITDSINMKISKVELEYDLVNPIKLKLDIPKKGEIVELNKEIFIEELNQRIMLKDIRSTDEGVELHFNAKELKSDNNEVFILSSSGRGWTIGSDPKVGEIITGVYTEDLSFKEKVTDKLDFEIKKVGISKKGEWKFDIDK